MEKELLGENVEDKSEAKRRARVVGKFTLGFIIRKYLNLILSILIGALVLILLAKYVLGWI